MDALSPNLIPILGNVPTLVGLLVTYIKERGDRKEVDRKEFMDWLGNHRHEELKNLISTTHDLSDQVDQLLRGDNKEILAKLTQLDQILSTILSRIDGFSGIVHTLSPTVELSEQAIKILKEFHDSQAEQLILMDTMGGKLLVLEPGGTIEVDEPRFVPNDLNTLLSLRFIEQQGCSDQGNPLFALTRNGAKYISMAMT